ncbi:hypothetical protein [Nitrolancea hollandica]|uniref:Uncharacterized protein n=1 Tax=Nitrolancea hollandica Lb TaxID=1129897 RepID=I4EG08_9BACT|nr:hypothetical protein [Nitrolancea hollandica]CCF83620.1 hypothetical protein NITHO_2510018 [Nitrolancea hollandica Lb]
MVTNLPTMLTHHTGAWQPERNETVTISKRLYIRLLHADDACQKMFRHVVCHPIRNSADVWADWARRDDARDALQAWASHAGLIGEGGKR